MNKLRIGYFAGTVVLGIVGLTLLPCLTLTTEPFSAAHEARLEMLSALPEEDVFVLKEMHAANSPRYDLGLFGNSRVLMVGSEHLEIPNKRFFNFGVSGISLRSVARQLERLHAMGKAPRTALVSLDHPAAQHPPRPPIEPELFDRWTIMLGDLAYAAQRDDLSFRQWSKHLAIHAQDEWRRFTNIFNFDIIRNRLRYWLGLPPAGNRRSYAYDGSRPEDTPSQPRDIRTRREKAIGPPAMERDFGRLARVAADGVRVIVYLSPIHPALLDAYSRAAMEERSFPESRFVELCTRYALECHKNPILKAAHRGVYWNDATHAPAHLLGSYLAGLIESSENHPVSRAARIER